MKKYIAIILTALLLCSCSENTAEESFTTVSETISVTSSVASSETTVTEPAQTEKQPEETVFHFNTDVSYKEEYLITRYTEYLSEKPDYEILYTYDEAGNLKLLTRNGKDVHYSYDYNPDGTYNAVYSNTDSDIYIYSDSTFYDENGYVSKDDYSEYTYEFDEKGRLTKRASRLETVTYEYDSVGRLKTKCDFFQSDYRTHEECYRYEYSDDTMTIYLSIDGRPEALSRQFTYDTNGNEVKAVLDMSEFSDAQRIIESEYDGENKLLKRTESVTGDFDFTDISLDMERTYQYDGDRLVKETINNLKSGGVTVIEYFYDGDRIIKEILTYEGVTNEVTGEIPGTYLTEYIYNGKSYVKRVHNADGSIDYEQEYTAVNVLETGVEYREYFQSAEPNIFPEKGKIFHEYTDRNGYTFYCTKDTLYVKRGWLDIAAMDITMEQAREFSDHSLELQPDFYTDNMPPSVALAKDALTYYVYFVIDGEFRKAEWYLNGEKLDGIDYTMLQCYYNGAFTAYSDWKYDYDNNCFKYDHGDFLLKHTFEFNSEKLCFTGSTEPAPISDGAAADVMQLYDEFFRNLYCYDGTEVENHDVDLLKLDTVGFRTRAELLTTLSEFCTPSAAEKICSLLLDGKWSDFKEIDGQLCIYNGPPDIRNSRKYLHSQEEYNGIINAVFWSFTPMQDVPYYVRFHSVEFTLDNGTWKISNVGDDFI